MRSKRIGLRIKKTFPRIGITGTSRNSSSHGRIDGMKLSIEHKAIESQTSLLDIWRYADISSQNNMIAIKGG